MKTLIDLSRFAGFYIFFFFTLFSVQAQQGVAISTDGSAPHPSAMLHVISDSMGLLIPNLMLNDTATAYPVSNPAVGLLIYNGGGMKPHGFYYWDGGKWQPLLAGKLAILSDADGDTKITVDDGTDPDEIAFSIDGSEVMRLDSATLHLGAPGKSLFLGKDAGKMDDGTENYNTFIGYKAGESNTGGWFNTFAGYLSGQNNLNGKYNTFFGSGSGNLNTLGSRNAFFGHAAGNKNNGNDNTFIGLFSGFENTSGTNNTYLGSESGKNNLIGINNTGIGDSSLLNNQTSRNTAIGSKSMYSTTSGKSNTAVGANSLFSNLIGENNLAFGDSALFRNTVSNNIGIGTLAGYNNSTGSRNIYLGNLSGYGSEIGEDGDGNVAVGNKSLFQIRGGKGNVAIGDSTLLNLKDEDGIVAIGMQAGLSHISGPGNTYIGQRAGKGDINGSANTFVGYRTGELHGGGHNTFLGYEAGRKTSGWYNVFIGNLAGANNTTGIDNTYIGTNTGSNSQTSDGNTLIGRAAGIYNSGNKNTYIGNSSGHGTFSSENASNNTAIGNRSLYHIDHGQRNVAIGDSSGISIENGSENTIVGAKAGSNSIGSGNIFLGYNSGYNETGNDKLYIDNSDTIAPLIYGDFNTDIFTIHGKLGVGTTSPKYLIHSHNAFGKSNYLSFTDTITKPLSNDGVLIGLDINQNFRIHHYEDEHIDFYNNNTFKMRIENSGDVGIGTSAPGSKLHIVSTTEGNADGLKLTQGSYNALMYLNSTGDLVLRKLDKTNQLVLDLSGDVGIGTDAPSYKLDINGEAEAVAWHTSSDLRWKKNINPIQSGLYKVLQLQGVNYDWRTDEFPELAFSDKKQVGLIAQNVEHIIPEIVSTDDEGFKAISYGKLTPYLIEAVKEQQRLIEKLMEQNKQFSRDKDRLDRKVNEQQLLIEKLEARMNRFEKYE